MLTICLENFMLVVVWIIFGILSWCLGVFFFGPAGGIFACFATLLALPVLMYLDGAL